MKKNIHYRDKKEPVQNMHVLVFTAQKKYQSLV